MSEANDYTRKLRNSCRNSVRTDGKPKVFLGSYAFRKAKMRRSYGMLLHSVDCGSNSEVRYMENIRLKIIKNLKEAQDEIEKIGSDKHAIDIMAPKAVHRVIKIEKIDSRAANILKQEMLSVGGECAIARNALTLKQKKTDILIMGTIKQYERVLAKLSQQPFGLKEMSIGLKNTLKSYESIQTKTLKIGNKKFNLGTKTYVMGVLNVTPDSFSGDGVVDAESAVDRACRFEEEGADIIDIGGESSRPYAKPVSLEKELERVVPVVKKLSNRTNIPISIDTYKSKVAERALELGADMVNDISALRLDKKMPFVIAKHKVPVALMHMKGTPRTMQKKPFYEDVIGEICSFLSERIGYAVRNKIEREDIIIDPGIGFGKTVENNLEIIRKLSEFRSLGCSILIGPSRKSFIGKILDLPIEERLEGTLASISACITSGADIIRVHDVKECVRHARMIDAIIR